MRLRNRGGEMESIERRRVQTTLGDLITTLSEETGRFLRNETETSLVVSYIVNDLLKRSILMTRVEEKQGHGSKRARRKRRQLSYWQIIFLQSRVNGCNYMGECLQETNWQWPHHTWLQTRLGDLKELELQASHQQVDTGSISK